MRRAALGNRQSAVGSINLPPANLLTNEGGCLPSASGRRTCAPASHRTKVIRNMSTTVKTAHQEQAKFEFAFTLIVCCAVSFTLAFFICAIGWLYWK